MEENGTNMRLPRICFVLFSGGVREEIKISVFVDVHLFHQKTKIIIFPVQMHDDVGCLR